MTLEISTPALLFPALSLLMLAYTNRHLALASVIRQLHTQYRSGPDRHRGYLAQIESLRWRMKLVRNMQFFGVSGLLLCTVCMVAIFLGLSTVALVIFSISLVSMIGSLLFCLLEIAQSVRAIDLHLSDLADSAAEQSGGKGPGAIDG
ncbi:MAG TPA: DUF2721 domain-containing protein [Chthoniobacterales bacterium]|jgi:hypothetical protein